MHHDEISQEIHDNIGQVLSLAKLHLATMEAGGDPVLEAKIRDARMLVTKALADLRQLCHRISANNLAVEGGRTGKNE